MPAGLLFRLLRKGKIRVNGKKVAQNYRIEPGDELTLPPLQAPDAAPSAVPPALTQLVLGSIIFEDDHLIVVNKPADVAVHKGTGVPAGVIEALRHARPDVPELELVHRLDRETSGVLLVAKTSRALRYLQRILAEQEHKIKRYYLAVVHGSWPGRVQRILAPLRRTKTRTVVASPHSADALRAETHFQVVRRLGDRATIVQVRLLTGRKHQIRVHCQHAGHPIACDSRYGSPSFNRWAHSRGKTKMMLHAHRVEFPKPDGTTQVFEAPVPPYFPPLHP